MSYSRWVSSEFYTYWMNQEELLSKEDEIFCCHFSLTNTQQFNYLEVVNIIADPETLWEFEEIQQLDQIHELLKHFRSFIKDVNNKWDS